MPRRRMDVGVGGADADLEAGGGLREGVALAQVDQRDQRDQGPLRGPELALAVTLPGADEHGEPLDKRMRRSSAAGHVTDDAPRQKS